MCGIFGILSLDSNAILDGARFSDALKSIKHRGPDSLKYNFINEEVIFGHARLSVIDLSDASNQPMNLLDRYWLTFNGEIFNYFELRTELELLGVKFVTSGDVEVLLYSYIYWGEECVSRFNGMWSFAIYDTYKKKLFCSRDRFGEKPFNYVNFEGKFYFSSEIKPIVEYEPDLRRPNFNAISNFCRSSVGGQHNESWFREIFRLPPGCNLIVENGAISINRYWNYPDKKNRNINFTDACEKYKELFIDSVKIRMRSDVPIGLTLSGGIDSNSIAYTMHELDASSHYCYTSSFLNNEKPERNAAIYVDSNDSADEVDAARKVANEIKFNSVVVQTSYSNFVSDLSKVVYHLESGHGSPAILPFMQLHKRIGLDLKVVLEGQGADELLCGYVGSVIWQSAFDQLKRGNALAAIDTLFTFSKTYKIKYSILLLLRTVSNRWPVISKIHQKINKIDKIFGSKLINYTHIKDSPNLSGGDCSSSVDKVLREQHSGLLVNLLHYGDAISMANGIESRMPFLDYRLVEFVWSLPSEYKIKTGVGKYIHREAMRGLVPDHIIDNPIKFGFCTPITELFRNKTSESLQVLMSERCMRRGLFDKKGLGDLVDTHVSGKHDHGPLLFRLLCTELWFRLFIDENA